MLIELLEIMAPVVLLMIAGWGFRYLEILPETIWRQADDIVYYILFPALIIYQMANTHLDGSAFIDILVIITVSQTAMFLISCLSWIQKGRNGPLFTSIVQNNVRINSYIALGIITAFLDKIPDNQVIAGIMLTTMIVSGNIISVFTLLIWGKSTTPMHPFVSLLKNPLLIAATIGWGLWYFALPIPNVLNNSLRLLADSAMPVGLLITGAGLIWTKAPLLWTATFWVMIRLLLLPACVYGLGHVFPVTDTAQLIIATIIVAAPTANASYILSQQMGGDSQTMALMIALGSLMSLATIPLVISILQMIYG